MILKKPINPSLYHFNFKALRRSTRIEIARLTIRKNHIGLSMEAIIQLGSPKYLAELFDLGMTSTRAIINEMRASKKWRTSVVSYDRMLRVNVKDFETYWKTKSFIQ